MNIIRKMFLGKNERVEEANDPHEFARDGDRNSGKSKIQGPCGGISYVILALNFFGVSPLNSSTRGRERYQLQWTSWWTFCCGVTALWNGTLAIFSFIDVVSAHQTVLQEYRIRPSEDRIRESFTADTNYSPNLINTILSAHKVMLYFYPVSKLLELLLGWTQAPLLKKLLESGATFEEEANRVFGTADESTMWRFNRKWPSNLHLTAYVGGPTAVALLTLLLRFWWDFHQSNWAALFIWTNVSLFYLSLELTIDAQNLILYRTVLRAYERVHQGILEATKFSDKFSGENVISWRRFIQQIREHCGMLSKYQKPLELFYMGRFIVLATLVLFLALNLSWTVVLSRRFLAIWVGLLLFQGARLAAKTYTAESITSAEKRIADLLMVGIPVSSTDLGLWYQIKFTYDVINIKPVEIAFFKKIVMNQSLLLGIFTQVVTYLVVLMQFAQSNK